MPGNYKALSPLLFFLLFITSCTGQDKVPVPPTKPGEQNPSPLVMAKPGTDAGYIIRCGLVDKTGKLWFGTTGGYGVFRYDPASGQFSNFTEKDGLCDNRIYSILQDKSGNIWLGGREGVCLYDGKNFSRFALPSDTAPAYTFTPTGSISTEPNFPYPSSRTIVTIYEDKKGHLWFGTMGVGAYKYDRSSRQFTRYQYNEGAVYDDNQHHNIVQSILEDKSGNIWFASMSRGGVSRYNTATGTVTNYTYKEGLADNMIACLLQDKAGNIWIGSRDFGAFRYNGQSFTNFTTKEGLCSNNISCIMEDKAGNLWLGSDKGGLCRYDGNTFTVYTKNEGLQNNHVWTLVEDMAGNIWVGTRGGKLYKYDGRSFTDLSSSLTSP